MNKGELIVALYDIGAVKFGEYKLKSGIISPIYIDLRVTISFPKILEAVADMMLNEVQNISFDLICGVPYTALPIATVMSIKNSLPMVMRRKEIKDYGTRKAIEGVYKSGQTVLIIEDLVTSGSSVFETVEPLKNEGLTVLDVVVLLDREQGGKKHLADNKINLHSVIKISELISMLQKKQKIDYQTATAVEKFIANNQT